MTPACAHISKWNHRRFRGPVRISRAAAISLSESNTHVWAMLMMWLKASAHRDLQRAHSRAWTLPWMVGEWFSPSWLSLGFAN